MLTISKILTVIDPTASVHPALDRATCIAHRLGAEVELLICYYNEYLSGERFFDTETLATARDEVIGNQARILEALAEPLRKSGIVVKTTVVWDNPLHEGIVRQAVKSGADIVLKDTHHHSAIARAFLSNTDWNLIRTCPMPLWLVKPRPLAERPVLVAAIDPMNEHDKPAALDDEILVLSKMLGERLDGEVHAFHSYDPLIALASASANPYVAVSLPLDDIEQRMHNFHKKRFDEITGFHGIAADKSHLVAGTTLDELRETAESLNADVVVMGAIGRNMLKRIFIGATAERTLEHLPCDLLIVKPSWFKTPVELSSPPAD